MADFNGRRENLVRAALPGVEYRSDTEGSVGTLHGHFSVFDSWYEVRSSWEGHFLERVAPGAYRKTFSENRDNIRVLYDHGHDPSIGNKPLGPLAELREDDIGGYYEVPLLDTSYVRDLLPGLQAGLYGASFRFRVVREDVNDKPAESEFNPYGLPERTIREAQVMELGPVTFPASPAATAGVRSMTDRFILSELLQQPEQFRSLILNLLPAENEEGSGEAVTPTQRAELEAHPSAVRRAANAPLFGLDRREPPAWQL
jgi:HK97 family phage prohead protease